MTTIDEDVARLARNLEDRDRIDAPTPDVGEIARLLNATTVDLWLDNEQQAEPQVAAITAGIRSLQTRIGELERKLASAEAALDTQMRANNLYREAMDERNDLKNAARAAEAQAEASSLTARRDGERDGLLKAADLIDARERDAHAEAALRAQDGDRAGDMHWCAKSLALNQAAKTLRALASTVPGGEEPS
jgi:hypothetical protein